MAAAPGVGSARGGADAPKVSRAIRARLTLPIQAVSYRLGVSSTHYYGVQ